MKLLAATIASLSLMTATAATADQGDKALAHPTSTDVQRVAPALERYKQTYVDALWQRPGLSTRDRSVVTLAALIARDLSGELPRHIALALDNGVEPAEISEIITHLAFYAGWANAMSAVAAASDVFEARNIPASQAAPAAPSLLPLDEEAEAARATRVEEAYGSVSPGLVQYTTDILFLDLWLRPALAPRDRSLVTVSALIATGQIAQVPFHLGKAMDNGLTQEEAGEMITQLGFYASWPKAFSAMSAAKEVFAERRE